MGHSSLQAGEDGDPQSAPRPGAVAVPLKDQSFPTEMNILKLEKTQNNTEHWNTLKFLINVDSLVDDVQRSLEKQDQEDMCVSGQHDTHIQRER